MVPVRHVLLAGGERPRTLGRDPVNRGRYCYYRPRAHALRAARAASPATSGRGERPCALGRDPVLCRNLFPFKFSTALDLPRPTDSPLPIPTPLQPCQTPDARQFQPCFFALLPDRHHSRVAALSLAPRPRICLKSTRGHGIRAGGEIPWERSSFRRLSDERSMAFNFIVTHSDGPL